MPNFSFKLQWNRRLYIYPRSTHLLTHSSVSIMLLYLIWSLSPGSGLVLNVFEGFEINTTFMLTCKYFQRLETPQLIKLFFLYIVTLVFGMRVTVGGRRGAGVPQTTQRAPLLKISILTLRRGVAISSCTAKSVCISLILSTDRCVVYRIQCFVSLQSHWRIQTNQWYKREILYSPWYLFIPN